MAEKTSNNKFSKYVAIVLVIAIIAAVGVYAYTNFVEKKPSESENNNNTPPIVEPEGTLLTISVGSQSYNYTLNNLTALGTITGHGSGLKSSGAIIGPNNYTGVSLSVLLNSIPSLPDNYTVQAIGSGDYSHNFTKDEVSGHVQGLNETVTIIVAYKENGILLNDTTKGPLRIAIIGTQSALTNYGWWVGSLNNLEIIQN